MLSLSLSLLGSRPCVLVPMLPLASSHRFLSSLASLLDRRANILNKATRWVFPVGYYPVLVLSLFLMGHESWVGGWLLLFFGCTLVSLIAIWKARKCACPPRAPHAPPSSAALPPPVSAVSVVHLTPRITQPHHAVLTPIINPPLIPLIPLITPTAQARGVQPKLPPQQHH